MIENNRIIIVDDVEEDLQKLSKVFYDHGIGCKTFTYDGLTFPNAPLNGVRFAFFDIHLSPSPENIALFSTLKDAISKYISEENGIYVLIFWSNRKDLVPEFIEFINRTDDSFKAKLKPIALEVLDKNEFINPDSDLETKLNAILSNDIVECLIKFDEAVLLAATQTLDNILSIIPFTDQWGKTDQFSSDCKAVFSKIAEASYGFAQAQRNPDAAIKEAITPVFESILKQNNDSCWKKFLTPLSDAGDSSELQLPMSVPTAKLNSIFHIDSYNIDHRLKTERGAVCPITEESIEDVFSNIFKIEYRKWIESTFKFKKGTDIEELISTSLPILMEFSASCDFSQNKKRTEKYLLGIIIDAKHKIHPAGEYTLILPPFEYSGRDILIGLNLNYNFIDNAKFASMDNPIFIIRKEMMDMIGNKYASHISRIGITSFQ